jgi:nitrogen regulatory protein PII
MNSLFLVVLVVDDPEHCPDILEAWQTLGVKGATVLESTGMGRLQKAGLRDDLPLMPSLSDILAAREVPHRTLLSVVDSQEMVDEMIIATQGIIGNLDEPHTGFLFVAPVLQAYGLGRK